MNREDLLQALQNANVQAFLRLIRQGESSQDDAAYTVMFGGSHFESIEDHPRKLNVVGSLKSTAAGAYQFLARTWDEMAKQYGLNDFGPTNQDIAALGLIVRRKAFDAVVGGRIREAVRLCRLEWASLPGAGYNQPEQKLEKALDVYLSYGGAIADEATTPKKPEGKPMAPLIIPILSMLSSVIPELGKMFGSGSEVAQRNVAAGAMIADRLVQVTQAVNLQEAAEKIQNDPEILRAAKEAVSDVVFQLSEAGGGGLDGARKANLDPTQQPPWKDKTFLMAVLFYPLIAFVIVASMLNVPWLAPITAETRAGVIMFVLGTICGGFLTYFTGTTVGSQKKDATIASRS
jgi:muramidase (phage lysozyme)